MPPTGRPGDAPAPISLEDLIAELRRLRIRVTPARQAVLTALVEGGSSHLTAVDLAASVQQANPQVHLATIYRSLDSLEAAGLVDHVHLGHGRGVYHLAHEPHQHLVCELCGTVVQVPDDVFSELAATLRRAYGFTIRPHHFALVGRCAECAEEAQAVQGARTTFSPPR
ncbi:MAG: Fur family transcriptional regulator [Acidimicrobiales bacterium]